MAVSMSASDDLLVRAAAVLCSAADSTGDPVRDADIQAVLAGAARAFAARFERQGKLAAFPPDAASATEVAVTACAMLEALNIGIFELSMWQSLKGSRSTT